jgi:hypothetical protein
MESIKCVKCNKILEDPRVLCSEEHCVCNGCIQTLSATGSPPTVRCPGRGCTETIPAAKLSSLNKPSKFLLGVLAITKDAQRPPSAAGLTGGEVRKPRLDATPLNSVLDVLQKGKWKTFQQQVSKASRHCHELQTTSDHGSYLAAAVAHGREINRPCFSREC